MRGMRRSTHDAFYGVGVKMSVSPSYFKRLEDVFASTPAEKETASGGGSITRCFS